MRSSFGLALGCDLGAAGVAGRGWVGFVLVDGAVRPGLVGCAGSGAENGVGDELGAVFADVGSLFEDEATGADGEASGVADGSEFDAGVGVTLA